MDLLKPLLLLIIFKCLIYVFYKMTWIFYRDCNNMVLWEMWSFWEYRCFQFMDRRCFHLCILCFLLAEIHSFNCISHSYLLLGWFLCDFWVTIMEGVFKTVWWLLFYYWQTEKPWFSLHWFCSLPLYYKNLWYILELFCSL